jgi:hypothetical protein
MGSDASVRDLTTPEHQATMRGEYRAERAAWIAMALILLAALLGGLGHGILSDRRIQASDGSLSVEYSALERYQATCELRISVKPPPDADEPVRLSISRTLVDRIQLKHVSPPPAQVQTVDSAVVLTLPAAAVRDGGPIVCRFEHERYGPVAFDIGLVGGQSVRVRQFVLP